MSPQRERTELTALKIRLQWERGDYEGEDQTRRKLLRRIAEKIPHQNFIHPAAEAIATAMYRKALNPKTAEKVPSLQSLLERPALADDETELRAVLRAMKAELKLRVMFHVHGRVPFVEDIECEPFGKATRVRLIAGHNKRLGSHTSEIIGVFVEVPLGDEGQRFPGDEHMSLVGRGRCSMPELDEAALCLEHILATLRTRGVTTLWEPVETERLGPPYTLSLRRSFSDGSSITRRPIQVHGVRSQWGGPGSGWWGRPLKVEAGLFRQAWDSAAAELALVGR